MKKMKDKIIMIVNGSEIGYVFGLSENGNLYKIDPIVKKTWELVQYSPFTMGGVKDDKKGKQS